MSVLLFFPPESLVPAETYTGPLPLQNIIPSYLYEQYADDDNLQAFIEAFNALSQGYLDWFNDTPLSIYTSPSIDGPLLDWVANGLYGFERPVFSTISKLRQAGLNALPLNAGPLNGLKSTTSGTATLATDDYFRRVLTWWLYKGDGPYFNIEVLRKKIARFLYGANGTDVTLSQIQTIHIATSLPSPASPPPLGSIAGGTITSRTYGARATYANSLGETLAGPAATLTVPSNNLLTVASPPAFPGATGWYPYAAVTNTAPTHIKAGLNGSPLNTQALNGTNRYAVSPLTRQVTTPIAIGTTWDEPSTGLVAGAALPSANTTSTPTNFLITIPASAGTAATLFKQGFNQGLLAFPFMFTGTVVLA